MFKIGEMVKDLWTVLQALRLFSKKSFEESVSGEILTFMSTSNSSPYMNSILTF